MGTRKTNPALLLTARLLTVALLLLPVAATAQERSVTVTAEGRVKIRPDTVEIHGQLIGAAPIAADAMKKYQQHRQRLVSTLEELKIANLETQFGGTSIISSTSVNQMQMMQQGQNAEATPSNLSVTEPITIRLTNVADTPAAKLFEDVLKVVDAANDNGLQLSEPANRMMAMQFGEGLEANLAMFLIRDEGTVRRKAIAAAMADARTRAGDIAALAEAKLGAVKHVKEAGLSSGGGDTQQNLMMQIYGIEAPKPKARFSSPNFGEIEVTAKLEVEFLLTP